MPVMRGASGPHPLVRGRAGWSVVVLASLSLLSALANEDDWNFSNALSDSMVLQAHSQNFLPIMLHSTSARALTFEKSRARRRLALRCSGVTLPRRWDG
jgi:hypothetical protein